MDWVIGGAQVLGALATAAALIVGYVQLKVNTGEIDRQRQEQTEAAIREQAVRVSAWHEELGKVTVRNASDLPIYEVVVSVIDQRDPTAAAPTQDFMSYSSVVATGDQTLLVNPTYMGMSFEPGAEISFRDASGRNWHRDGSGTLTEINQSPIDYYGLSRPVSQGPTTWPEDISFPTEG